MDVVNLSGAPSAAEPVREARHDVSITVDPVRMEGGSRETALPQPEISFARQQAVSEDRGDVFKEERVLDEVAALRQEHRFDVPGVLEEEDLARGEPEIDEVPVLAPAGGEEAQDIARKLGKAPDERMAARTRRPVPGGTRRPGQSAQGRISPATSFKSSTRAP
jgi:hypothetical protein